LPFLLPIFGVVGELTAPFLFLLTGEQSKAAPLFVSIGVRVLDLNWSNGFNVRAKTREKVEYAGILREVPHQEGNERCQKHHHEERQTGN
jgi:hypothetical protein